MMDRRRYGDKSSNKSRLWQTCTKARQPERRNAVLDQLQMSLDGEQSDMSDSAERTDAN